MSAPGQATRAGGGAFGRYAAAAGAAVVLNLALFGLLESLILFRGEVDTQSRVRPVFEFLRLRRDETTETKTRRAPERQASRPTVKSAPLSVAKSGAPGRLAIAAPTGNFGAGFALTGRPTLGGEGGFGTGGASEAIPLVRVNPLYPPRAQARGVEGWVLLEFTITPEGRTKDITVVDADPRGYFERAATDAVKKFKYKPRVEDGVAVDWPGVQLVLSFDLED